MSLPIANYCYKCRSRAVTDKVCLNPRSPHYKKERGAFDTCEKFQRDY